MLAATGLVMAIYSLDDPMAGPLVGPPGHEGDMWRGAFFVGVTSFVLAIIARRRVGKRQGVAKLALGVAIFGAIVWVFPACVEAGSGL